MLYGNTPFSDTQKKHIVGCIPFYPITFPVNPQFVDDLPNKYPIRSHLEEEAKEMDGNGFRIFPLHSMVPREEQDRGEPFIGFSFDGPVG
jgi:hypothetical protein